MNITWDRALVAPLMFFLAACFMILMTVVESEPVTFMWMFILFSFFFGAPYLVVGTAIATDLVSSSWPHCAMIFPNGIG